MNATDIINGTIQDNKDVSDEEIDSMLFPNCDNFINNPFRRIVSVWDFKILSFINNWKEVYFMWCETRKMKKREEDKIKTIVRSHKLSFQRFNDPRISSRAERTSDNLDTIRGFLNTKTNRKIINRG